MELYDYNSDVDVVERCRVSPAPGGSVLTSHAASLTLTFFDLLWLSFPPVERLFFFNFPGSKMNFFNTIVPKLKQSLSLTLQHFYPLAGNLTWPLTSSKPQILCNPGHDSVAFTVAVSHQDFSHLSANHNREATMFLHLLPELSLNSSADNDIKAYPVLALQVTLFPHKGICIGVTNHHSVADARGLINFFKSWAAICDATTTETPLVCCDRSLVNDPKGIDMILLNSRFKKANITQHSFNLTIHSNVAAAAQHKLAATFVIRQSDIKRLRQCVLAHSHEVDPPQYLSTFVLTCAYVWVCLIKARGCSDPAAADVEDPTYEYLIFPMDCRGRREPPLPVSYFGNCVASAIVKIKSKDLINNEQGIAIAAKLIRDAVQRKEDGSGILANTEAFSSKDFLSAAKGKRVVTVTGSTKMDIYGTNFGWGKLKKVEVASIVSSGSMSLYDCSVEVGAVEVGLVRDKVEMDSFTSLSATILAALP